MPGTRSLTTVTLIATALAGALVVATSQPAQAQRKSIRWAVASVDTYGYKVAASVTKIIEEALGGEYAVTVNPYPSTTAAMKATMEGDGEIGYTADIGMSEYATGDGAFRNYWASKGTLVHTWYAYPMESMLATSAYCGSFGALKESSFARSPGSIRRSLPVSRGSSFSGSAAALAALTPNAENA